MLMAEADFMIKYFAKFNLFGIDLGITTTHISLLIVMIALITFGFIANRCMKRAAEVPGTFQNIVELIVEMLDKMVSSSMGKNASRFRNYICTIFFFIFLSNIGGVFGLRSPTADYGVTLLLGLVTFVLIHYSGIKAHKVGHFTALFKPIPLLFPINIVGEFATPLSLSLRLFGNIMSGTVMIGLWYGMMPLLFRLGVPAFLHAYFDLFSGAIQTYVFCMLTMVYVTDKIE